MHAIQIESPEVFEGIMHGFMHKGITQEAHTHSSPEVLYISTSDRAADFEVKGILRKNSVPHTFIACGYTSIMSRIRGRTRSNITVMLSPEVLHIDPILFCGKMSELIEFGSCTTLIAFGPNNEVMLEAIRNRMYSNYKSRNPTFVEGSVQLTSNLNFEEFRMCVSRVEASLTIGDSNTPLSQLSRQYFFGEEFLALDQHEFHADLLKIAQSIMPSDSMVFHPKVLERLFREVLCSLKLTNVIL
ncbi:hypothetical protein YOLOSWAG_239 [Erwinia phage vB_EamM_Yoloswag]|uniref:Uncharacterized protein n=1 Tax=Erwinia phage vB_EamM_Yoloswag TaxID=1958956 RepID=A0A1S6L3G9_9CAUD|nr:hypothetical protein HOR66_gp239 [Erwinia phage vB_EamM_Yoloswag]AQT28716.1 hypothetical protein YOLOSWAG_239 [Erwinia phage vB_EamM_Yoloswag]